MADSPEQLSLDPLARAACSCEYVRLPWGELRRFQTDPDCPIHG